MNQQHNQGFIPMIDTPAGQCLTAQNWRDAGITGVSVSLEKLLIKPGLPFLLRLTNLKQYLGWSETLVLNATMPAPSKSGDFVLRSSFDGSRISISIEQVEQLIVQLNPDDVISSESASPWIESDTPAANGMKGRIYTSSGVIDITDSSHALQFFPLDDACACPTCQTGFTRAYLHHLLAQTPLLCQRYLIQHNVWQRSFSPMSFT